MAIFKIPLETLSNSLKSVTLPQRLMQALTKLRCNKNIVITYADKGGKVVSLHYDYRNKLSKNLADSTTYSTCNSNPLKVWQLSFNRSLKTILKDHPALIKKITSSLSFLPYMYDLPKIHKPGNPLRPIVSSTCSVSYSLSDI